MVRFYSIKKKQLQQII